MLQIPIGAISQVKSEFGQAKLQICREEVSLDVSHPLLINAISQAKPAICRNKVNLDVVHPNTY